MNKFMMMLLLAVTVGGCAYNEYDIATTPTETKTYIEYAEKGDTFNELIGKHYSDLRINGSWDEWQARQRQNNEELFKNGRCLQPGDKIVITTKVRK